MLTSVAARVQDQTKKNFCLFVRLLLFLCFGFAQLSVKEFLIAKSQSTFPVLILLILCMLCLLSTPTPVYSYQSAELSSLRYTDRREPMDGSVKFSMSKTNAISSA